MDMGDRTDRGQKDMRIYRFLIPVCPTTQVHTLVLPRKISYDALPGRAWQPIPVLLTKNNRMTNLNQFYNGNHAITVVTRVVAKKEKREGR